MIEVIDNKIKDLLMLDSEINLREDDHKSFLVNAVEIKISHLEEGIN